MRLNCYVCVVELPQSETIIISYSSSIRGAHPAKSGNLVNPRCRLLCGCAAAILFPALASAQSATLTQLPSQSTTYTVTVDALPASPVTGYSTVQEFTVSNQIPSSLGLPAEL